MEQVVVWLLSDNDESNKIADSVNNLNITLNKINGFDLSKTNIIDNDINIFLFNITKMNPSKLLDKISKEDKVKGFLKFIFFSKKEKGSFETSRVAFKIRNNFSRYDKKSIRVECRLFSVFFDIENSRSSCFFR